MFFRDTMRKKIFPLAVFLGYVACAQASACDQAGNCEVTTASESNPCASFILKAGISAAGLLAAEAAKKMAIWVLSDTNHDNVEPIRQCIGDIVKESSQPVTIYKEGSQRGQPASCAPLTDDDTLACRGWDDMAAVKENMRVANMDSDKLIIKGVILAIMQPFHQMIASNPVLSDAVIDGIFPDIIDSLLTETVDSMQQEKSMKAEPRHLQAAKEWIIQSRKKGISYKSIGTQHYYRAHGQVHLTQAGFAQYSSNTAKRDASLVKAISQHKQGSAIFHVGASHVTEKVKAALEKSGAMYSIIETPAKAPTTGLRR